MTCLKLKWKYLYFYFFLTNSIGGANYRSERAILYPKGTVLQVTSGLSVPLILPRRSINFSLCYQINYDMPYNVTQFKPPTISKRSVKSGMNRRCFYKHLIEILNSFDLDGESCLLRAICEASRHQFETSGSENLLEKIFHHIFTPSSYENENDNDSRVELYVNQTLDDAPKYAERIGKSDVKCDTIYSSCQLSLLDLISKKYAMK